MPTGEIFTVEGILAFHRWTHASLQILLDHIAGLPPEAYSKRLDGFGLGSIRDQMVHTFECEVRWIHRAQGNPFPGCSPERYPTVADARRLRDQAVSETRTYLTSISSQQLNTAVEVKLPEGGTIVRTPAELVHHILTHAFHHKGQVVAMCRLLGSPAPNTDLIWLV